MANEHQWVLWELHRVQASLEDVFRELTAETETAPAPDVEPSADSEPLADPEPRPDSEPRSDLEEGRETTS